ncbi:MAG TPA: CBS domain-containing protein [Firmicutes bacterium]|nr:CBS domain-containing protein [Bacillota bacterium]
MNILFFLIPKSQVCYGEASWSLRQIAEKMVAYDLTAIPVLNHEGQYVFTISEGDLFRFIKLKANLNYKEAESTPISELPHERQVRSIRFDAEMKDLVLLAGSQNFVPVVDGQGVFMGIITRQTIIRYLNDKIKDIPDPKIPDNLR